MNKKGFAISVVLYTMVLLVIGIFYLLLGIVRTRYTVGDNLKEQVINGIAPGQPLGDIAYGDASDDGVIDMRDSLKIVQYLDLGQPLTLQGKRNADVNADGKINHIDPVLIAGYISGHFDEVLPDEPIKTYTLYGDLNEDGLLTNDDYNKLRNYIYNNTTISAQAKKNADVNGNGKYDEIDIKNLKARLDNYEASGVTNNSSRTASLGPIVDYVTYGDVNEDGIVDIFDSVKIVEYLESSSIKLNDQARANADVNADDKLSKVDSILILRYDAGWYEGILPTSPITDYVMYGDVTEDGRVDGRDSLRLHKFLNGTVDMSEQAKKNADVNADGSVNNTDLQLLDEYLTEIDDDAIPDNPLG